MAKKLNVKRPSPVVHVGDGGIVAIQVYSHWPRPTQCINMFTVKCNLLTDTRQNPSN